MRRLLAPRWIAAHLVVVIVAVTFISLGLWQLDRNDEKRLLNTIGSSRFEDEPLAIGQLIDAAVGDVESLEYRRALASGTFDPDNEVLIRSQVYLDTAGFHLITPLVGADGSAILVNRGWIPLVLDQVPVTEAAPPSGVVTVEGWVHTTQTKGPLGPADPETGELSTLNRVDIDRIAAQTPYELAPLYLVEIGEQDQELPVPAPEPSFDDQGPHLGYAIQWFAFTLIGLVGYSFLIRRSLARGTSSDRDTDLVV